MSLPATYATGEDFYDDFALFGVFPVDNSPLKLAVELFEAVADVGFWVRVSRHGCRYAGSLRGVKRGVRRDELVSEDWN